VGDVFDLLVGRETPAAAQALAAAPDHAAVAALPRIDDAVTVLGAEGTPHLRSAPPPAGRSGPSGYSLPFRAMFRCKRAFSRLPAALISTCKSRTASTTRCWSSSTWKLTRKRRARWKSARFRVISMLRDSSPRPLLPALPAGAGAATCGCAALTGRGGALG